ncbi:zinc-dependent alcohol dehydrogenase family protein [Streptomyces sp. NPDC001980]|uniref:zinc-dependent alcohol dehydrogenase family protein n=1 Tax=Streptomyces sp. NPDC001980 TaxID=3157126 RepID=UPI0033194ADE
MRAIQFTQYGEPTSVLHTEDVPVPDPGPGQVKVRVLESPVNPSDLLYVRGYYAGIQAKFPSPTGFEGVGIVEALGSGVHDVAVGERVSILNFGGSNWAEYAVNSARDLFHVPDDVPDDQAASFVVNPAAAIVMVRHVLAVPRGEWLLQSAAGSELGRMIIRLAKREGIRTVNVVRRRESAEELRRLGADAVILSTEGPIDEQVRSKISPEGVKYAIDPVVGETGTQIFKALHEDGHMLVYGSLTGEPILVGDDPRYVLAGRRILEVFWLGYWLQRLNDSERKQLGQDIIDLMREGILKTSPGQKYSLEEIHDAVTQAEQTGRQGKVYLVPGKK